jgi:GT2 family glycosyltransferase
MSKSAKIGIVTVTYNSADVLHDFLRSLDAQTHTDFLLYAVDNASRDSTLDQLRAWGDPRLRIIANSENIGIAAGNNQAIHAAIAEGCDYILFLNNDVEFEPETFADMVADLDRFKCDLLAPKILYEDGVHIWSAGGTFKRLKGYLGSHTGEGERDQGQYDQPLRILNAPGCCILVRTAVFEQIGMMDAKYFVYHEDADFLFRAWRAGLVMYYTPRARILHKVSALTGGSASEFTIRYNARGHVYFMLKNLGLLKCLFFLPALEVRMIWKFVARRISYRELVIRQRAFLEGIAVWVA